MTGAVQPAADEGSPAVDDEPAAPPEPQVYYDHDLPTERLDPEALKVVRRLKRFGYEAYLVGGCVRDLALDLKPKDFDVATSARAEEVRRAFRNCRIIGRRFRLCHIYFHDKIIEVASFRTEPLAKLEEDAPAAASELADQIGEAAADAPSVEARAKAAEDESEIAPWERDAVSETRERQTIDGRRAQAREEPLLGKKDDGDADDDGVADEPADVAAAPGTEAADRLGDAESADARASSEASSEAPPVPCACDPEDTADNAETAGTASGEAPRRGRRRRRRPPPEPVHYGTADEDARLRDFSLNALFYDPDEDCVIDYVGGWDDLLSRRLRVIGDPDARMIEDPVRILRAVKITARNRLRVEVPTWEAMVRNRGELAKAAPRRLLEEVLKLLASGAAVRSFRLLAEIGCVETLLPELVGEITRDSAAPVYRYLRALDEEPKDGLDPAVLVATLFYSRVARRWVEAGVAAPGAAATSGARRLSGDRIQALAEEDILSFGRRGAMSRRNRFLAVQLIMAQRLLLGPPARGTHRAERVLVRDWGGAALALLRVLCRAEGRDPAVADEWADRVDAWRESAGEEERAAWAEEEEPWARPQRRRSRGPRGGGGRRGRRRPR